MPQSRIKKVRVERLRPGMYVHDLGLDWLSHPFLRSRFLVESDKEVARIVAAGVRELYIDAARGEDDVEGVPASEVAREIQDEMVEAAAALGPAAGRVELAAELPRATEVRERARQVVQRLMTDARMGRGVEVGAVDETVSEITASLARNTGALLSILHLKHQDDYTFLHCVSVGALMVALSRSAGQDEARVRELGIGGIVHDIGKSKVPLAILNKPDRLTQAEFEVMKRHPTIGHDLLRQHTGVGPIPLDVTLHHHERVDGTGYPEHLPAAQISDAARMAAVCDIYDAITSERCYHRAIPPAEALRKLFEWSRHQLARDWVERFIRCLGIYPVGSVVALESGRIGVVLEQDAASLLAPRVRLVIDADGSRRASPLDVELARPPGSGGADRIVGLASPRALRIDPQALLALPRELAAATSVAVPVNLPDGASVLPSESTPAPHPANANAPAQPA